MQSNQGNSPIGVNSYGQTTGIVPSTPFITVLSTRNPNTYDFNYPVKQRWINTSTASEFILTTFSNVTGQTLANWLQISNESGAILTLTGNYGGAVGPSAGNINVEGDGTTISITGNPSTHTLTASLIGGLPAIETIQGDLGSVSGNTIQLYANTGSANAGSSVKFSGSGTQMDLIVTDSLVNTIIGESAGNILISGNSNTALGFSSLKELTSGDDNVCLGHAAGFNVTIGNSNTLVGYTSGQLMTTGSLNTFLGNVSGVNIITGSSDILIGNNVGSNYTGAESSNIIIGNAGTASESNVIRIGTNGSGSGQQNKSFMAGVTGVTVAGSPMAVSSTSQMSDLGYGTIGQLLTSNGNGVSPTWQTNTTSFFGINVQTFTTTSTYTPSLGMAYCIVEMVGGGGGGGGTTNCSGSQTSAAGGGGGGEYAYGLFSAATIGSSKLVTIGAAGTAGTTSNRGGTGGTTYFGTVLSPLMSAVGGMGGTGCSAIAFATGVLGGNSATGGVVASSGYNSAGSQGGTGVGIPSTNLNLGGAGGSSPFGGGGNGTGSDTIGQSGTGFGSGGSGACTNPTASGLTGGTGTTGFVKITEFIA